MIFTFLPLIWFYNHLDRCANSDLHLAWTIHLYLLSLEGTREILKKIFCGKYLLYNEAPILIIFLSRILTFEISLKKKTPLKGIIQDCQNERGKNWVMKFILFFIPFYVEGVIRMRMGREEAGTYPNAKLFYWRGKQRQGGDFAKLKENILKALTIISSEYEQPSRI